MRQEKGTETREEAMDTEQTQEATCECGRTKPLTLEYAGRSCDTCAAEYRAWLRTQGYDF